MNRVPFDERTRNTSIGIPRQGRGAGGHAGEAKGRHSLNGVSAVLLGQPCADEWECVFSGVCMCVCGHVSECLFVSSFMSHFMPAIAKCDHFMGARALRLSAGVSAREAPKRVNYFHIRIKQSGHIHAWQTPVTWRNVWQIQ